MRSDRKSALSLFLLVLLVGVIQSAYAQQDAKVRASFAEPVIWQDPGNISARDLRYGPGAANLAPLSPFTFIEEVKSGESPKIGSPMHAAYDGLSNWAKRHRPR